MPTEKRMELLAPVGTVEALFAAVQNGADAVYLGGKQFSARQYAQNFDLQELKEVVRYAHLYGVQVYIAVNTLIDNEEFPEFINYLYSLYNLGVDAIIMQDIGAAYTASKLLPEMKLHASTQMTISNSAGARLVKNLGFDRVVLAREVSLENIRLIREAAQIDLEVFVHGALCVSYSGQCLMSSMIGGRSGNRGRCAQPCRLPYTLLGPEGKEFAAGHLLSPKDLRMVEHLPLLRKAGISSLKVEGRMKRAEYVAVVIRNYRQALDSIEHGTDLATTYKELSQIFNRDFTSGYYLEKPGPHLMSYQRPNNRGLYLGRVLAFSLDTQKVTIALEESLQVGDGYEIWVTKGGRIAGEIKTLLQKGKEVAKAESGQAVFKINNGRPHAGDRVFKTLDIELIESARQSFISPQGRRKHPLDMILKAELGKPVRLFAEDDRGNAVETTGDYLAEKAKKYPLTQEAAEKQLNRLGNTIFYLRSLEVISGEELLVPASELNNLRRLAVEKIEEQILSRYAHPVLNEKEYKNRVQNFNSSLSPKGNVPGHDIKLSVTVGDLLSVSAAAEAGADIIYFGGEMLRSKHGIDTESFEEAVKTCHSKGAEAVLLLPRVFHEEKTDEIRDYCNRGAQAGVDGFLTGNLGTLQLALEMSLKNIRGDYPLNIYNNYSIELLQQYGVKQLTLSPELTLQQIMNFKSPAQIKLECLIHGRMPLMITEHCTVGNNLGQGHQERGCPMPCKKGGFGLRDRMKMVFPLECDEFCRMLVYNPKTLCLFDRLPSILKSGASILRIEARREEPVWVKKVTKLYRQELKRYAETRECCTDVDEKMDMLRELSPDGFTAGHYYRGVL